MKDKSIFEIKWLTSHTEYYKYGARIQYTHSSDKVIFENNFMPAGETLIKWLSNPIYQVNRTLLQLPLLKRNCAYKITSSLYTEPKNSVMLKVTFYDRSNTIVYSLVFDSVGGEFSYPEQAYTYSIEIINTGVKKLIYNSLYLSENLNSG